MKTEYTPLDISSLLESEEMIVGYLSAAAEDEDPNVLLGALAHVAKARGMASVAEAAGLGRESLYKALAPGSHPRFETIQAVLRALNVDLRITKKAAPLAVKKRKPREDALASRAAQRRKLRKEAARRRA
jgi:probable addiction module antidote protein